MRWLNKRRTFPKARDKRRITVFAWRPIKCTNVYTVWLERVIAVQEFERDRVGYSECRWITHYHVVRER